MEWNESNENLRSVIGMVACSTASLVGRIHLRTTRRLTVCDGKASSRIHDTPYCICVVRVVYGEDMRTLIGILFTMPVTFKYFVLR